jgi:(S)-2-hydroxy-acid oxidase
MSPSVSWKDVERFTSSFGLPVVVKGVLTSEDALLACEHGAGGIVVSNHGGRQLAGVRALALGARAVLAGRAPLRGLVVGGEGGARRVLELLQEEIGLALQLVGCHTPAEVTRAHVGRRR